MAELPNDARGRTVPVELTDHLIAWGPDGTRRPVTVAEVQQACAAAGDRWAERLVARIPSSAGVLEPDAVDRLLLAVHCEIQRLSEEFLHGARMWERLAPIVAVLAERRQGPVRVVDVGCGTGYVVRWLSANAGRDDVELVGLDINPVLVGEARRLAAAEGLRCRFEVGDALDPAVEADVLVSTGVLHHIPADELGSFFAGHERSGAAAFVHVDFQPSWIAPFGSWLFHRTRMRNPIARHDGIRSAQRAHPPADLCAAVDRAAPGFQARVFAPRTRVGRLPCVLTNLIGARGELADAVWTSHGSTADRLVQLR